MTKQQTVNAIRAMGMAAQWDSETREYRITYLSCVEPSGERREAIACYTGDAEDALGTARDMFNRMTPEQKALAVGGMVNA